MFRDEIEYRDLEGNPCKDTYYFHLFEHELMDLQMDVADGSLFATVEAMVEAKTNHELVALFKRVILGSVGERTADNKHFNKTPEYTRAFEHSAAFGALYIKMLSDEAYAARFITGILPSDLQDQVGDMPATLEGLKAMADAGRPTGSATPIVPGPELATPAPGPTPPPPPPPSGGLGAIVGHPQPQSPPT